MNLNELPILIQAAAIITAIVGSIYSIILHEIAHGFSAFLFGDTTAKDNGRLSLNPIRHVDLVGTIILPLVCLGLMYFTGTSFLFGWAKPVPVNPGRFRNRKLGNIVVSLAGVLVNFILAGIFLLLFLLTGFEGFKTAAMFNILLFAFNLIPLPPLDGFNFVMGLLPEKWTSRIRIDPNVFIGILMLLMFTGLLRYIYMPIMKFVLFIYGVLFSLAGLA